MRYTSEHKAETRARVLKEAAAALRAKGPERLGVAAVMSRAGLTHGGFYAHFASKDALLAAAVDHMFAEVRNSFFPEGETIDARSALRRYTARYLSMRHRDARDQGCPVPILAGELHRMPEGARERFVAGLGRMTQRLTGLLERAGVADPQPRAASAVAEMVGAISLARLTDDRAAAEALLADALRSVRRKLCVEDDGTGAGT